MDLRFEINYITEFMCTHVLNIIKEEGNEEFRLIFDVENIFKDKKHIFTLYDTLNEYLAMLDDKTKEELFRIYHEAYEQLSQEEFSIANSDFTIYANESKVKEEQRIQSLIERINNLINYNSFKDFVFKKSINLYIPENTPNEFIYDKDLNVTEDQTYTKPQYIALVALILYLRLFIPVFINYYNTTKSNSLILNYKTLMLFSTSEVYQCEEMLKLRRYIESNFKTVGANAKVENLVMNFGLSTDEVTEILLGEVLFNKLIYLDFFSKECNVISYIYQTIISKSGFKLGDNNNIRAKTLADDPSKEDISYYEDYRKTSNIPLGTIVEIQYAISDTTKLVKELGYANFNYEQYMKELEYSKFLYEHKLDKVQIFLLGWFMNKVINPRALYYIEYKRLIELATLAKVILINNNHKLLGAFMTSFKISSNMYINSSIKNTVSKENVKKLSEIFKFFVVDDKEIAFINDAIITTANEINNASWIAVGDKSYLEGIVSDRNILMIPYNLIDLIVDFVVFCNS